MFFSVETSNGVPIYDQIVRQIKYAIAGRTLRPGQLLPSVRQVSKDLAINPNTVARAFQELQSEGLIESLRGRGMVVSAGAVESCRKQRKAMLAERIEQMLTEALRGGMSGDEIRAAVDRALGRLEKTVTPIGETSVETQS